MAEGSIVKLDDGDVLLNEQAAATVIGCKPGTLRNWRYQRRGPRYYSQHRRIVYRRSDLTSWLLKNPVDPEAAV